MDRRHFLKTALLGVSTLALDSIAGPLVRSVMGQELPPRTILRLRMIEALVEQVDETPVYSWVYEDDIGPHFPGPVIVATEGQRLDIVVYNKLNQDHAFSIPGVVHSGTIRPGQERLVKFRVPTAGTYIYHDPLNAPMNRVMGLHGVLVSMPASGNTPYSNPTTEVQQLFNDFGTTTRFPGAPWAPADTTVWVFTQIDPILNERVRNGEVTDGITYGQQFLPRYFMINGRTGYFSAHAHDTMLHDAVGHPRLIRNVNVGIWAHSPHVHANHVLICATNGLPSDNILYIDTWTIYPTDRIDVVYPFIQPPDIPPAVWSRFEQGIQDEALPLDYPMHCHTEMSQTAAGGNYPQGLVADIHITGPLGSNRNE